MSRDHSIPRRDADVVIDPVTSKDTASEKLMEEARKSLDLPGLMTKSAAASSESRSGGGDPRSADASTDRPRHSVADSTIVKSDHYQVAEKLFGKSLGLLDFDASKNGFGNSLVADYFRCSADGDARGAAKAIAALEQNAESKNNPQANLIARALRLVDAMSTVQNGVNTNDVIAGQRGLTDLARLAPTVPTAAFILDHFSEEKDGARNPLREAQVKWAKVAADGGDEAVVAQAQKTLAEILTGDMSAGERSIQTAGLALANYTLSAEARKAVEPQFRLAQAVDLAETLKDSAGNSERFARTLSMVQKLAESGNKAAVSMIRELGVENPGDVPELIASLSDSQSRAATVAKLQDWKASVADYAGIADDAFSPVSVEVAGNAPDDDGNDGDKNSNNARTESTGKIYTDLQGDPTMPESVKDAVFNLAPKNLPPGSSNLNDLKLVPKDDVHTRNDILVRHYVNGDQTARANALEGLRQEVQNGNLSAMQRLAELALLDGTLKFSDASKRARTATSQAEFDQAQADQKQALRDLATLEIADKKRDKGVTDLLNHAPKMGVSPEEITQARQQARAKENAEASLVQNALVEALHGTGSGAVAKLEQAASAERTTAQMASNYLSGRDPQELKNAADFASGTISATKALKSMSNPSSCAEALLNLEKLARGGNTDAERMLVDLERNANSKELLRALRSGDKKAVAAEISKSDVAESIQSALSPSVRRAEDLKSLKAEDLLKAFSTPQGLEDARKSAIDSLNQNHKQADTAFGAFIERGKTAAERQQSLDALNKASQERIRSSGDYVYESMRLNLESIQQVKKIHAAAKLVEEKLKDASADVASQKAAVEALSDGLKELSKMAGGNHSLAHSYLNKLLSGREVSFDKLMKEIEEHNPNAFLAITRHLPTGDEELNEYRANRIVRDLGPNSSAADFARAHEQLEAESRIDKDNQSATDWLKWTAATKSVKDISDAAKTNNFEAATSAVKELSRAAREGNPYARAELSAVLLGRSDVRARAALAECGFGKTLEKPTYLPDLKGLDASSSEKLLHSAIEAISENHKSGGFKFTREEAGTLVVALADATSKNDARLTSALKDLLDRGVDGASRTTVMEAVFTAIQNEVPGAEGLANVYLRGAATDPILAKQFRSLSEWARLGDTASMRIIAGIASGIADKNETANPLRYSGEDKDRKPIMKPVDPISDKARTVLVGLADRPSQQARVLEAITTVYARFGDSNQLLATLGQVAEKVDKALVTADVRDALQRGVKMTASNPESQEHKSAVSGLLAMAKHWDASDIKVVGEHLTPTLTNGLRERADEVPTDLRKQLLVDLHQAINTTDHTDAANARRLGSIKAMGAFAKMLDKEQVETLASFGGVAGIKRLSDVGITGDASVAVQKAAGKALLRTVAMSENAPEGQVGPRETAYKAFLRDGYPGLDESTNTFQTSGKKLEPRDLREALLKYAEGRAWDVELSKEIGRIVYDAGLPRPTAGILHDFGIPAKNSQDLLAKTNTIIANYENKAAHQSGEDVVRRVASNIDLVNALPPALRAKLMGSPEQVDKAQVAGQMLQKTLEISSNKALLEDLPKKLEAMSLEAGKEVDHLTKKFAELRSEKSMTLAKLADHTKTSVTGARFTAVFGSNTLDKFEEKQVELVRKLPGLNMQMELRNKDLAEATQLQQSMELARKIGQHTNLENKGLQKEADRQALQMWQEHGAMLQKLAPTVWRELVSSDGMQSGRSVLARMRDAGMSQFDTVPSYESGKKGFDEALSTLKSLRYTDIHDPSGFTYKGEFSDTAAMRAHALGRVSDDQAFQKLNRVSKTFNQSLPELAEMFKAAQQGTKFDTYVNAAQDRAKMLQNAMRTVTSKDLADVRERITSMQDAVDQMKAHPDQSNREAVSELQARIANYKQMHDLLNPNSSQNYDKEKDTNGQIRELIAKVTAPDFRADTFANWAMAHGPVILATVVAVAATVAACASFGVTSPLAIAAWASVAGLAAAEITRETLYQYNKDGYSGIGVWNERSSAGTWASKIESRSEWENVKTFFTEVAGPYAGQVVVDTALAFATMGISKFALSGFSSATFSRETLKQLVIGEGKSMAQLAAQAERAAVIAEGNNAAGLFMRQYMQQFGKELLINSGFTAAHLSAEKGIETMTPQQLKHVVHEGQPGIAFGLQTSLGIGQGWLAACFHSRGGKVNFKATSPQAELAFIESYRKGGFEVKPILAPGQTSASRWEVRAYNQDPKQPSFVLERGTGLPEKDLFPGGAKQVVRPEGATVSELPREVDGHGTKWTQSEPGQKMIGELQGFTEAVMKGDFEGAYKVATNTTDVPANFTVKKNPVDISLTQLKDPASADMHLQRSLKDMGGVSKASRTDGKLVAEIPQPVLEIEPGVKVDILEPAGTTVNGKALTAEQLKKLNDFKASDAGQRIFQEMAINAMEERIHLRQLDMGVKIASPSYARFVAENPHASVDQINALRGTYDQNHAEFGGRSAATMEQEAILALHDSDPHLWNSKNLRHHFGNQHADVREPLFKWVENQERLRAGGKVEPTGLQGQPTRLNSAHETGERTKTTSLGRNDADTRRDVLNLIAHESTESFNQNIKPGDRKTPDVAQQLIFEEARAHLRRPSAPGKPSPHDEGWRFYQARKDSPADHAKMDYILVNENTGKYHIVDATAQLKSTTSNIRTDSIIRWNDKHLDGKTASNKMLNNEGKDLVRNHIDFLLRKEAPLDLLTEPPPSFAQNHSDKDGGLAATKADLDRFHDCLVESAKKDPLRSAELTRYSKELRGSRDFFLAKLSQDNPVHQGHQKYFETTFADQQITAAAREWVRKQSQGTDIKVKKPLPDREIKYDRGTIQAIARDGTGRRFDLPNVDARIANAVTAEATKEIDAITRLKKEKKIDPKEADRQLAILFGLKQVPAEPIRDVLVGKLSSHPLQNMLEPAPPPVPTPPKAKAPIETPETKALEVVTETCKVWDVRVPSGKDAAAKASEDVKAALAEVQAKTLNPAEQAALSKIIEGYKTGDPNIVKQVHDHLNKQPDTKALGRNEDEAVLPVDKGHERLAEGEIKTVKLAGQGQEKIDVYFAKQTVPGQPERDVIVRTPGRGGSEEALMKRAHMEDAAYETSKLFNGGEPNYPAISAREVVVEGKTQTAIVQEHAGTTLSDFVARDVYRGLTPGRQAEFKAGVELAAAQRQIMGDSDFSNNNFAVRVAPDGKVSVSNIDMGRAFTTELRPSWGIGGVNERSPFGGLPGKPLSPEVRGKVEEFVKSVEDPRVVEQLSKTGLQPHQIGYMKARAKLLLLDGFPK
ncbi:MAG: hypothetical protein JST89_21900 [Cyanobacteria bacterium SZAS-4]|nr:hypothetical protein [Cyanobacteria bacterium SZAS-4]